MATTYTLISSVTVGSGGAATIDFTSIPSTYTDLCVKLSCRGSDSATVFSLLLRLNSDSGSNYSYRNLYVDTGNTPRSTSSTTSFIHLWSSPANTTTANTFSNTELYIPNYAGANFKSVSAENQAENNASDAYISMTAGLWSSTSAITSINLLEGSSGVFMQYSTAYLYGISNA
jgi:hypothetical protein